MPLGEHEVHATFWPVICISLSTAALAYARFLTRVVFAPVSGCHFNVFGHEARRSAGGTNIRASQNIVSGTTLGSEFATIVILPGCVDCAQILIA